MTFKTSLFKKGLIISDLKRFWWVSALYALILFFLLPYTHFMAGKPVKEIGWINDDLLSSLKLKSFGLNLQVLLICVIPVVIAVLLFRYLHSIKSATTAHSLPVRRESLYMSHSASGLILIAAPVIIVGIILMVLYAATFTSDYYQLSDIFQWMGYTLMFDFFFFAFTVFVGVFTGSSVAQFVFTYILNILPAGIYVLWNDNLKNLLFGYSLERPDYSLLDNFPIFTLVNANLQRKLSSPSFIASYIIATIIFLTVGLFVYRFRRSEAAGEVIAFKSVKPVFKYGVAICCMLAGGLFFSEASSNSFAKLAFGYLIFSFIGYWISEMLVQKSFKVWKAYKGYAVLAGLIIIFLIGIYTDVIGYVHKVPDVNSVERVYVGYSMDAWKHIEKIKDWTPNNTDHFPVGYFIEEPANIQKVIDLHKAIIEKRDTKTEGGTYIIYTLKDGTYLIRQYHFRDDLKTFALQLKPIFESPEYKKTKFPLLNQKADSTRYVEIRDGKKIGDAFRLTAGSEITEFITLLQNEMRKESYEEMTNNNIPSFGIQLANDLGDGGISISSYGLPNSYTSVIDWLKTKGYYNQIVLLPQDVDSIVIEKTIQVHQDNALTQISSAPLEIKDPSIIKEALDSLCSYGADLGEDTITFYFKQKGQEYIDGNNYFQYCFPADTPVSDKLRAYIDTLKYPDGSIIKKLREQ